MPAPERTSSPAVRHWLDPLCAAAAPAIVLVLTLFRASSSPVWRDDVALVRALGLSPVGSEGRISSVLVQLSAAVPIGGRGLRASWTSALALALLAYMTYALARRLLTRAHATPRLTPPLSLAAALTATVSEAAQVEGTVAGGAAVAAALVLLAVVLMGSNVGRPDARRALSLGCLLGLTLAESHAAGVLLLFVLAAQATAQRALPTPRTLAWSLLGAGVVVALCAVPLLWRILFVPTAFDYGHGLEGSSLAFVQASDLRTSAIAAWLRDVGAISLGFAVAGMGLGLARRATRSVMVPLAALLFADLALPASRVSILSSDPLGVLRLLGVVALGISAGLGVQAAARALALARIPFAEPASVLIVVFDFTLVFIGAEDSALAAEHPAGTAAEVWTDEALVRTPPSSLLLLRSQALAFRFLSARLLRGERPDVLVVPMSLLERGNVRAHLLAEEPALAPLIRETALSGKASEYALSTLADARPLLVELDPSWETPVLEHLLPRPFFMQLAPEPRGRSDRELGLREGRASFQRVISATERAGFRDEVTRSVLLAETHERMMVAAALGDHKSLDEVRTLAQSLDSQDVFARELATRLAEKPRGKLAISSLAP